jgi:hypothetical protein
MMNTIGGKMNSKTPFTAEDIRSAGLHGISEETLNQQLSILKHGLILSQAVRACTPGDGIKQLSESEQQHCLQLFEAAKDRGRFSKMVPASGAATRMFKFVFEAMDHPDRENAEFSKLMSSIDKFPFYEQLKDRMTMDFSACTFRKEELARTILMDLNFGSLPKGLIPFHRYSDYIHTALDEHFVDSSLFLNDTEGQVRLHFTMDAEFLPFLEELARRHNASGQVHYITGSSIQKPSTQTLALSPDGNPARDQNGGLLFRPGGHGSLLANLQDLNGDLVFLQNIDNVGREEAHADRVYWKKMLGGYLIQIESEVTSWILKLKEPSPDFASAWTFAREYLGVIPDTKTFNQPFDTQRKLLSDILNRPIRVCGMVKNEGEPGGGPFWVAGEYESCQILEKSQVDISDPEQVSILEQSTHFNPVDLVCSVRTPDGKPYNLADYVDLKTCFISEKSVAGKRIQALEHPGLWNGAMAKWNTAFVEVPLMTFTPVKTVNDLLRPSHQPPGD